MSHIAGIWKDLIVPINGLGTGVTAPAMTTITGNIQTYGFQTGDYVYGAFEIQHDYEENTDLYVHIHWSPNSTNTGNVVFNFEYTIADINGTFPAAATLAVTQAGSGTSLKHQLASFTPQITGTIGIGTIISFRLLRNATGDTYTGLALVHSIGIHYKCNSLGSNQIASKN